MKLSTNQIKVISSPEAMDIIMTTAKETLATKYDIEFSLMDGILGGTSDTSNYLNEQFGILVAAGIKSAVELLEA